MQLGNHVSRERKADAEDYKALAKDIEYLAGMVGAKFIPYSEYQEDNLSSSEQSKKSEIVSV